MRCQRGRAGEGQEGLQGAGPGGPGQELGPGIHPRDLASAVRFAPVSPVEDRRSLNVHTEASVANGRMAKELCQQLRLIGEAIAELAMAKPNSIASLLSSG